jgi:hypothetical protein
MFRKISGIFGVLLFFIGILLGGYLVMAEKLAASRDNTKKSYGMVAEGPLPCKWEIAPPPKVMSEDKSQAIVIKVENLLDTTCESVFTLQSPGFDINPNKPDHIISLPASRSGSLSWILTPRKTGTYDISISDTLDTKIFGITVTNTFGLTALQAQIFSFAGSLFGPMFTIPWWWEKLRKKKNSEEKK